MFPRSSFAPRPARFASALVLLSSLAVAGRSGIATAQPPAGDAPVVVGAALAEALRDVPASLVPSGLLLDRALSQVDPSRWDGSPQSLPASRAAFRQWLSQLEHAGAPAPSRAAFDRTARRMRAAGVVPVAIVDARVQRLRPDGFATGALRAREGRVVVARPADAIETLDVTAAASLGPALRRGLATFVLDPGLVWSNRPGPAPRVTADFGDGAGPRALVAGRPVRVRWTSTGTKVIRVLLERADGSRAEAAFEQPVTALAAPVPDDTLQIVATQAHQGVFGTGRAYVRYGAGHTSLVNPIVVPEGFDLDNSMDWDPLYELLDQQGLADSLHARGYDAVVLDFTDATRPIQENAFVLVELLQQVQAALREPATLAVVGPSMGGLCSRYALAWMESHGVPHRVRTWVSFDTPHLGAVIPVGLQHWIDFFAGQSADADAFRSQLNSPAARQMLIHHYAVPAPATPQPDPARAALLADFAAVGDWPALPRRVAVANGSAQRADQGFAPGAQLIRWNYSNLLVTIVGHVWALPSSTTGTVFDGRLRILFSDTRRTVTATGTPPWDGAPGGFRGSLAQLDTVAAPYGDIVALHPNHAFIPTISALALTHTSDPFHDVAGDPDLLAHTPFDAVFVPDANEEHVAITPASAAWFLAELEAGVLAAPGARARTVDVLGAPVPNPARGATRLAFSLGAAGPADLRVFDVSGREVATLASGAWPAGSHERVWDGRDAAGVRVAPGLYFARLVTARGGSVRRVVCLE